jgi:hypothetical protein
LKVVWGYTEDKGRGVFAANPVSTGEVIEVSPVTIVPDSDLLLCPDRKTSVCQHILWWTDDLGSECALGFGYLMLYNHSNNPSVEFIRDYERKEITVRALRDIKEGEELTIKYICEPWFEPAGN